MTMSPVEWDACAAAWRSAEAGVAPETLRRTIAGQRRRLLAVAIGEWALVVVFAGLSWLVAADGIEPWEATWLVSLWLFTLAALGFAYWNRRGTWRSLGDDVESYVRLARLRARSRSRAAAFGWWLLVVECVVVLAQLAWFDRLTALVFVVLAVAAGGAASACWVARRRARRELARLEQYAASSVAE